MSRILSFDADATRRTDTVYATPDIVGQRQQSLDALDLKRGERVVDLGVGPGYLAASMAARVGVEGRVSGIDISANMLELARQRCAEFVHVDVQIGDVTRLPYGDASFDAGVCTQVRVYNDTTYSFGMSEMIAQFVAGRDGLTAADAERWLDNFRALDATDDYFFSLNRYLFIAEAID